MARPEELNRLSDEQFAAAMAAKRAELEAAWRAWEIARDSGQTDIRCAEFQTHQTLNRQLSPFLVEEHRRLYPRPRRPARRFPPEKEGQLWEECPHCGREPVWMPLMVCDRCWPEGA